MKWFFGLILLSSCLVTKKPFPAAYAELKTEKCYVYRSSLSEDVACKQCYAHYDLGEHDIKKGKNNGMSKKDALALIHRGLTSCLDFHECTK